MSTKPASRTVLHITLQRKNPFEELIHMLLTMLEIVCCENSKCREFARVAPNPHRLTSYYCPVCGKVSSSRVVEINLADSAERLRDYLLEREGLTLTACAPVREEPVWH